MIETLEIEVDTLIQKDWEQILDHLATLFDVPVALIMRVDPPEIEVFSSNVHEDNPYEIGEAEKLTGLYCEYVIKNNEMMLIPNALKDPEWDSNPDIKLGMLSYLGFPLNWPGGFSFGTICVLDKKENPFNELFIEILRNYKSILENQLSVIFNNYVSQQMLRDQLLTKTRDLGRLRFAVENSHNAVVMTSKEGIIEYVNPAFTELTGYSSEEVLGQNPRILKSGHTKKHEYQTMWRVIKSKLKWDGVFKNKRKNGEFYWALVSISAILDEDDEITGFVEIQKDITTEREIQAKLMENEKMQAMAHVTGKIAHDLKNIIHIVSLYSELLSSEITDPELLSHLQTIMDTGNDGVDLIQKLQQFSRSQELSTEKVDLNELIRSLEPEILEKNPAVRIEFDLDGTYGNLELDPDKMKFALMNIVDNALEAMPDGGNLVFHSQSLGETVLLKISDNGIGIDPAMLSQLFEPFFTTKKTRGSGLGLSISYNIIQSSGGQILVESQLEKGTEIMIYLPVAEL